MNELPDDFGQRFISGAFKITLILVVVALAIMWIAGMEFWLLGVIAGFVWLSLNGFFLYQLFDMVASQQEKKGKKVTIICLVKFPVLYLIGLWILCQSDIFRAEGILIAFTLYIIAFATRWITMNKSKA